MTWQQELEEGRRLEAEAEMRPPSLPPRRPVRVMFDERGVLVGSIPDGEAGVVAIQQKRLN